MTVFRRMAGWCETKIDSLVRFERLLYMEISVNSKEGGDQMSSVISWWTDQKNRNARGVGQSL